MGLSDLDWRVVCCSDHLTATVDAGDGVAINVQKSGDVYGVTFTKNGLFVRSEPGVTEYRVQEIIASL